jgi:hypothetical protein
MLVTGGRNGPDDDERNSAADVRGGDAAMTKPGDKPMSFLDFEASSLGIGGFPIEAGWVMADGTVESYLIRPTEDWILEAWDPVAEDIHRISLEQLMDEGHSAAWVADHLNQKLAGHQVMSDAPLTDSSLAGLLLEYASSSPSFEIRDAGSAFVSAAIAGLCLAVSEPYHTDSLRQRLALARLEAGAAFPRTHRAAADALHNWAIWKLAGEPLWPVELATAAVLARVEDVSRI